MLILCVNYVPISMSIVINIPTATTTYSSHLITFKKKKIPLLFHPKKCITKQHMQDIFGFCREKGILHI